MQEKVKLSFDPIVEQAHKAHKEAIGQRDKYLKPLIDIERKFKDAILIFNRKMEQEQRERERIARALMEKKAEEERQRLLSESAKTTDVWDKEELKEKAAAIVPVEIETQKKVIEQDGLSIRKTWKASVTDESIVPRSFMLVNESALNAAAKQEAWRIAGIMGVEFYQEESITTRS